jgi:hypothetical protein
VRNAYLSQPLYSQNIFHKFVFSLLCASSICEITFAPSLFDTLKTMHLMRSIVVFVDVIISNINLNKSYILLLLSILLPRMTESSHKISCKFVAIFLTTVTATIVGKGIKRNAF